MSVLNGIPLDVSYPDAMKARGEPQRDHGEGGDTVGQRVGLEEAEDVARIHVILSEKTLKAIDKTVGARGRSKVLEQAAREKLDRSGLREALDAAYGVAAGPGYEHWKDLETIKEWVRKVRRDEPVPPP
jgi:hypothetical protein